MIMFSLDNRISSVKFVRRTFVTSLVIAINSPTESMLEVWNLVENTHKVNKIFKSMNGEPTLPKILVSIYRKLTVTGMGL